MEVVAVFVFLLIMGILAYLLTRPKKQPITGTRMIVASRTPDNKLVKVCEIIPSGRAMGVSAQDGEWCMFFLPLEATVATDELDRLLKSFVQKLREDKVKELASVEYVKIAASNMTSYSTGTHHTAYVFPYRQGGYLFRIKVASATEAGKTIDGLVESLQKYLEEKGFGGSLPKIAPIAALVVHETPIKVIGRGITIVPAEQEALKEPTLLQKILKAGGEQK